MLFFPKIVCSGNPPSIALSIEKGWEGRRVTCYLVELLEHELNLVGRVFGSLGAKGSDSAG